MGLKTVAGLDTSLLTISQNNYKYQFNGIMRKNEGKNYPQALPCVISALSNLNSSEK